MIYIPRSLNPAEVRAYKPNEALPRSGTEVPDSAPTSAVSLTGRWKGAEELRAMAEGSTPVVPGAYASGGLLH